MELHKKWLPVDLLKQAREDVLANQDKTYEKQNRVNLDQFKSAAVNKIADQCGALAWHPWRPGRSGAQIHDNLSKGESDQNWHQDIVALGGEDGCTVWVPLDPIDGSRPTIMFAGEVPPCQHYFDSRGFSVAREMDYHIDLISVAYRLELGDILMFSWKELHSTFWTPDMTNGRISLDLRFTPKED